LNKIKEIALMYKQTLSGRETGDELFEAGISAGYETALEESKQEEMLEMLNKVISASRNEVDYVLVEVEELIKKATEI
jgi:hypothetical protein